MSPTHQGPFIVVLLIAIQGISIPLLSGPPAYDWRKVQVDRRRPFRIGVLAHELTNNMKASLHELLAGAHPREELVDLFHSATQVSSNYVKFVQTADIEFYPILITDSIDLIIRQMRCLDGMLLPGGAPGFQFLEDQPKSRPKVHVKLNLKRRYFRKADQVIESAKYINRHIRPFALFGICLGFEMMILNESRFRVPLEHVDNQNVNLPVTLLPGDSRFRTWLQTTHPNYESVLANGPQFFYNSKGVCLATFESNRPAASKYQVLSTFGSGGKSYVAAIEHREYPFFGLQFHPEKNLFDFSDFFQADHSAASVKASRLFQDYFRHILGRPREDVPFDPSLFPSSALTVMPTLGYYRDLFVYERVPQLKKLLTEVVLSQRAS